MQTANAQEIFKPDSHIFAFNGMTLTVAPASVETVNPENTLAPAEEEATVALMSDQGTIHLDQNNPEESFQLEDEAEYCLLICIHCVPGYPASSCVAWAGTIADPYLYSTWEDYCDEDDVNCAEFRVQGPVWLTAAYSACPNSAVTIYWARVIPGTPCPW